MLDVGCGDGSLLSYLDNGAKNLLGIDNEKSCIEKANKQYKTDNTAFMCLGFEDLDTDRKYDAVIFVASLHHMDMNAAIKKAVYLLGDNGILLVVGIAKPSNVIDCIIEGLRIIPVAVISRIRHMDSGESRGIPVSYDFPSMNEVRDTAKSLLPGHTIRYGLYYRFLLKWKK